MTNNLVLSEQYQSKEAKVQVFIQQAVSLWLIKELSK